MLASLPGRRPPDRRHRDTHQLKRLRKRGILCICLGVDPPWTLPPAPRWNVTCAHGWQDGGGLFIAGTATLTNTNVYQNEAIYVCSLLEPSVTFHPSPRWNVTCARGWQAGGGLLIDGTATLTNTNVYDNQASLVCSPFELSSSAPLERYVCSWLAGWRGTRHPGHGNADRHQSVF